MKQRKELPEVEPVVLKPLFGIRPGIYLLVLYTVIILLLLFFIGFFPGIVKGGRYVTFSSPLSGSGLTIDGTYVGTTDYQYFVPSGNHTLSVSKADIEVSTYDVKIDHPVFFTWLFHRTKKVSIPLNALSETEKRALIAFDLNEILRYSAITDYDAVTVYPPLFANLKQDIAALGNDDDAVTLALSCVTSETMLTEAKAAFGDSALLSSAAELLTGTSTKNIGLASMPVSEQGKRVSLTSGNFKQDGISYQGGSFVMGDSVLSIYSESNEAGIKTTVKPFVIATTPVSEYQWALFLQENPSWAKSNVTSLETQGLTDQYYLAGINPNLLSGAKPLTNVSYHAAEAFCAWLSKKTGKKVFIPNEEQWSYAALNANKKYNTDIAVVDDGSASPSSMLGGLWEMTDSPYIPLSRQGDRAKLLSVYESYGLTGDIVVKGGSYHNKGITASSVGAVERNATGDAMGFRIAWVEQ